MSKYTTELRFICEQNAGLLESEGYNSIANIIEKSRTKIFDFPYPIFDEEYRSVLETKIIKHYYLREICAETVGVWKHFLDTKMNEIMPYYNKLYESELIKFNPLYDIDLTTDHNKEINDDLNETETGDRDITSSGTENGQNTGTSTLTDNERNDHWDLYQDTPQGGLTGIRDENYLTNARHITDDKTGSTKTTTNNENTNIERENNTNEESSNERKRNIKNIEDYIQHVQGKTAGKSYSIMLQEFRETFLNIDLKIINDLSDLFFNLW